MVMRVDIGRSFYGSNAPVRHALSISGTLAYDRYATDVDMPLRVGLAPLPEGKAWGTVNESPNAKGGHESWSWALARRRGQVMGGPPNSPRLNTHTHHPECAVGCIAAQLSRGCQSSQRGPGVIPRERGSPPAKFRLHGRSSRLQEQQESSEAATTVSWLEVAFSHTEASKLTYGSNCAGIPVQ